MVSALDKLGIKLIRFIVQFIPTQSAPPTRTSIITLSSSGRKTRINLYYPPASYAASGPRPVHVSLHSAGFTLPFLNSTGKFCAQLAKETGAIVVDADYSKGPENPWPCPVEDVDDLIKFAREGGDEKEAKEKARKKGVKGKVKKEGKKAAHVEVSEQEWLENEWEWDTERVSVGGFSSGACLALIGATRAEKNGGVVAVAAFYPSTNLAQPAEEKTSPDKLPSPEGSGGPVPPFIRAMFYRAYLPPGTDRTDPAVSPFYASPSSYPTSVSIVTCGGDALQAEARALIDKLKKAREAGEWKGSVEEWEAVGQGHAWDMDAKEGSGAGEKRKEAWKWMVGRLKEAYEGKLVTEPASSKVDGENGHAGGHQAENGTAA